MLPGYSTVVHTTNPTIWGNSRLLGRVAGAVIGEPLDRMQKTIRGSKPRIQALHHQVPDEGA